MGEREFCLQFSNDITLICKNTALNFFLLIILRWVEYIRKMALILSMILQSYVYKQGYSLCLPFILYASIKYVHAYSIENRIVIGQKSDVKKTACMMSSKRETKGYRL